MEANISSSSSGLSKRDEQVLAYAEYLQSDPNLWRITIAYMYSCGNTGQERGDAMLLRVPLRLHEQHEKTASPIADTTSSGGVVATITNITNLCNHHGREATRRQICRVSGPQKAI
jgi:nuclear pore complex protein Nup85